MLDNLTKLIELIKYSCLYLNIVYYKRINNILHVSLSNKKES